MPRPLPMRTYLLAPTLSHRLEAHQRWLRARHLAAPRRLHPAAALAGHGAAAGETMGRAFVARLNLGIHGPDCVVQALCHAVGCSPLFLQHVCCSLKSPYQPTLSTPQGRWERQSEKLAVNAEAKEAFKEFIPYFEGEMKYIEDTSLSQEVDILKKLAA